MSYELKMITCGTPENIEDTELYSPLINKILFDPIKIKNYIASHSKSVFFIVVFLNLFGNTIESILSEIGNQDNIIVVFICGNQINNLINNQTNVFYLSKRLLTCKTTSYAIRSYESVAKKLFGSGHNELACALEQKSKDLKRWLTTNVKVNACDVLLIPLNVPDAILIDFQQRLIELCNGLCPDHEPRVCTLYDYISSDECDRNMSEEDQAFINQHNKTICSVLKKLARIRIYVVGNEDCISNNWSKFMIENELSNGDRSELIHDEFCVFAENEPVTDESIQKLIRNEASSWRVKNIEPMILDKIRKDTAFPVALERGRSTLEAREMQANNILSLWAIDYHENCTQLSSEFNAIENAESGPIIQDDNIPDIDAVAQLNYQAHFPLN